jgi:glycosyltransferase involved in cell wall biosynthesis
MKLSIIVPVFNEEENVRPLFAEIVASMKDVKGSYEVLFVDDGSSDRTCDEIRGLNKMDKRARLVKLRKHFGKSDGLAAGFQEADGDIVITMDGDLQDDPKEIPKFLEELERTGKDMLVGWKYKRRDPITKRFPSKIFNRLTAWMTGVKVHDSNCGYKAFRKDVIKTIRVKGELHRYIPALAHWEGFSVGEMKVDHRPRTHGKSKYGVSRLLKGFLDLITIKFLMSYGKRPMHLFGSLGTAFLGVGFLVNLYLLYVRLWLLQPIADRPLLMLGILLMVLGVQFFSIGWIGDLIINMQKDDPKSKVRETF